MEQKTCLDTTVLVDLLRNDPDTVEFLKHAEQQGSTFATTDVTLFELYYGAYKTKRQHNIEQVHTLKERLRILKLSSAAAELAGKLAAQLEEKAQPLDFRDLLIGSIAVTEGYAIKTKNKKHFEKIPGLTLH